MAEPVNCPACGRVLRGIPENRRGLVTCTASSGGCGTKFHHPPTEKSTIGFRCSKDGSPFWVTFQRDMPQHKFTIAGIVRATGCTNDPGAPQLGNYAADVYEVATFYCPCCGYSPKPGSGRMFFVQCGECRDLVCAGSVHDKLDDANTTVRWFACHPACGHQGPITGVISEYQATRTTIAARLAVHSLPTPDTPAPRQIK